MSDPICRWRNPYLKTVRELIDLLPKESMPSEAMRSIVTESFKKLMDNDEASFFTTPYQLACQLGLYCENNDMYYPRFYHRPSLTEINDYLNNWMTRYYAPNPYTKSFSKNSSPIVINSALIDEFRKNKSHKKELKELVEKLWPDDKIGNLDILKNTINSYSIFFEIKTINKNDVVLIKEGVELKDLEDFSCGQPVSIDRKNKVDFFNHFSIHGKNLLVLDKIYFKSDDFVLLAYNIGLKFDKQFIHRFIASLLTKPFVILTGLSGSGKTKLAQAFVQWISASEEQYCIVPVGADWTNREPLLGYPNALKDAEYVKPENSVLDLIIRAQSRPDEPHFLILDEMNLSHVERYFADFLSAMESGEAIPLHSGSGDWQGVPSAVRLPDNLFIIGTVNIDETTNMFSPKVLDRANTIEFRVSKTDINLFLLEMKPLKMDVLKGKGANMAASFLEMSRNKTTGERAADGINEALLRFFDELSKTGAEFGYRSASEIIRLIRQLEAVGAADSLSEGEKAENAYLDIAVMQKLLPKLHGSRRKLVPVLKTLAGICLVNQPADIVKEVFGVPKYAEINPDKVKYPLSLEKISRMYQSAIDNGYASYAEA